MNDTVVVALLSCIGTIIGSLAGIMATSKLTLYRIERLEESLTRLNRHDERIYALETHNSVQDEKIRHIEETQTHNQVRLDRIEGEK